MDRCLIAVIDDDALFQEFVGTVLAEEGYTVLHYLTSDGVLEQLRAAPPQGIILDIRMEQPDSGWQVLATLAQQPTLAQTPVLICSADTDVLRQHADQLPSGPYQVVEKPFCLTAFLALVAALIGPPASVPYATPCVNAPRCSDSHAERYERHQWHH